MRFLERLSIAKCGSVGTSSTCVPSGENGDSKVRSMLKHYASCCVKMLVQGELSLLCVRKSSGLSITCSMELAYPGQDDQDVPSEYPARPQIILQTLEQ